MSIFSVSNVAKSFGGQTLFSEISFSLAAGQKMGLIGRNGGGKTTLLKILLGQEKPESSVVGPLKTVMPARVHVAAGRRLGYLRQEAPVHPERTLTEEIEVALEPLRATQRRLADAERRMAEITDDTELEAVLADYSAAHDEFEARGGYEVEEQKDAVLLRLGFTPDVMEKKVGDCSGGEQTRLALAKLALTRPDLLILDEPTNHLDIAATEWLEGFLKNYPGAVLLVSHDRYFLDAVVDQIAELEFGSLTVYKGNYSHFRRQKDERLERQQSLFDQQQGEINRLKDLIKRNMGADANASNIRHKTQGRIERMDKVDAVRRDTRNVRATFDAAGAGRIGREVLRLQNLTKRFDNRTLFSGIDAVIERGNRVGLVGPNGAGKTTLVKMLLGDEDPTDGTILWGHNVQRAYFSQHATDELDVARTVLQTLMDAAPKFTETQARNHLARFLFTGDDVKKSVSVLSGGEKNKLALARMLLAPCNLLILDEPTNHLDIDSCETLTDMLTEYAGTLLLISHDRYLLNAVTDTTFALDGVGGATLFEGNYAAWREAGAKVPEKKEKGKGKEAAAPAPSPTPKTQNSTLSPRELGKARAKAKDAAETAEASVARAESELARIETLLSSGRAGADVAKLAKEHADAQAAVDTAMTTWEAAVAHRDSLGD